MSFNFGNFFQKGAASQNYDATTSGDASDLANFAKTHSDNVDPHIYDAASENYGPGSAFQKQQSDLLKAQPAPSTPIDFGSLGKGIDFGSLGSLGKGFVDTFAPDSPTNVFKRIGSGFVQGAKQATEGVPEWGHELDQGPAGVFGKLFAPVSAVAGGALGALNAPFLDPQSEAFRKNQAGALEVLLGGAMTDTGPHARPGVREPIRATDLAPREPLALPAPRTAALSAPRPQLALPEPKFRPAPDVIPARAAVVDTTARPTFEQQIADSLARQKANPTPAADLANRHPISEADLRAQQATPTPPEQGLLARTGRLTPIGREDLTLGRGVAKPIEPVAPVTLDSLRARIGAKDTTGIPLDAEQLSARIGAKPIKPEIPANQVEATAQLNNNLRSAVEARTPKTGTLGSSGMSGPLVGRAVGRGNSQLARTGIGATGLEATPGDLSASLARQAKVHDANEAAIAAARSGDQAALARAKADVKLLGGDLTHTDARIRKAGGQRVTTDATTTQDFQASIDALKNKQAAGGKFMLRDEGASLGRQFAGKRPADHDALVARFEEQLGQPLRPGDTINRVNLPDKGEGYILHTGDGGAEWSTFKGVDELRGGSPPGGNRLITDTQAGPQSPASSLSERPKLIGMNEIAPATIGSREFANNPAVYDKYASGRSFMAGKTRVIPVDSVPGDPAAKGQTIGRPTAASVYIRNGLDATQFRDVLVHELEHAGQPEGLDLVASERRAYASHGAAPSAAADAYAKQSEGWPAAGTPQTGLGRSFLRDSFDTMVGDAGKMSPEDIAAAKAKLADRMGVNAETGRAGAEPRVTPRTATAGGPPKGPISFADLTRKAENITGAAKTVATAASPFHFMFRHALPSMVAHPQAWLKGSVKGLGEGFTMNPKELAARQKSMQDNLTRNGYGDVYIGRPHMGIIGGEESVASSWVNKVPVLGKVIERSGQGFVQGLNEVRYEMTKGINDFAVGMAKNGLAEPMTAADRARMADTINTFTGRGVNTKNMGDAGKATMRALNVTMFSPQMAAARVKMLGYTAKGMADVLHNIAARKPVDPVALERARLGIGAMAGIGGMYAIASALGGKVDTNLVSTNAGKVDVGPPGTLGAAAGLLASETGMGSSAYPGQNVMIDPTESESGLIRTIARLAVSIHDVATNSKDLMKMEGAKQETTPMDVATRYAITQLFSSPVTYPLAQFLQGFAIEPTGIITPMPVGAALKGAGIQPPTIGGKPAATPKAAPNAAPTRRPVAAPTRKAG